MNGRVDDRDDVKRDDAAGLEIAAALRARHAGIAVPEFDTLCREAGRRSAGSTALQADRPTAAAADGSAARGVPARSVAARGARWALAAVVAALAVGILLGLQGGPRPESAPDSPVATAATAAELPPMWYVPTDELLRIPSLSYATRPATMTTYDPIDLEIR